MSTDSTSSCACTNGYQPEKTLTLTHDFKDNTTSIIFSKESQIFSLSVSNDSSIIKQALEETMVHI